MTYSISVHADRGEWIETHAVEEWVDVLAWVRELASLDRRTRVTDESNTDYDCADGLSQDERDEIEEAETEALNEIERRAAIAEREADENARDEAADHRMREIRDEPNGGRHG